jgi:4-hydroxyphenylpyruvate dioxygenase
MGPFPHDAAPARIDDANPAGTDGFAFVEFAHPDPAHLAQTFQRMGFAKVARHKRKAIDLYRQDDVTFVVNAEPASFASGFAAAHGPCAPSMAWRVVDAAHAFRHAVQRGAEPYTGDDRTLDVPAIRGIGGSLLYFVDRYGAKGSPYAEDFEWLGTPDPRPVGAGFHYLDHLTHNVQRGNMDKWFHFYADLFNFRQIRFFDIEGKLTGLFSRALTSPCGRIRIPINESADERSQIEEYLREYRGEGIQHIALGTDDLYAATDHLAANGVAFMPGPNAAYYARSFERVKGHTEPLDRLRRHGILIDGEGVVDGAPPRLLLQIFSQTVIGPIFFEFIQRKGDDGFGEGNFRALFESIEADQIRRGVLEPAGAA